MATVTQPIAIKTEESDRPADITADEFFAMVEAGVFADRRVFLWGGRILEKMSKTVSHAFTSVAISEAVRKRLPDGWLIWIENPIQVDPSCAPLPDLTVVRGPVTLYRDENRHPAAKDAGLIVETAVTSLPKDLRGRAETFARALVPTYWVADVKGRQMIEHREPRIIDGVGSYASVKTIRHTDEIELFFDGVMVGRIPVAEMLI